MRASVVKRLNKRNFPSTEGNLPLPNPLNPGDIINIVEEVKGSFHGNPPNDIWFRTDKGYYVWSGGTIREPESPIIRTEGKQDTLDSKPSVLKPYNPNDFWWIKDYGIDKIWERGITGRGVKVAVLDEGLNLPHPDLPSLSSQYFRDITNNGKEKVDINSHGTHVFGILAAINNGFGITGICFNSEFFFGKIHHYKFAYDHEYLISGLDWAIENKVDIISISQGSKVRPNENVLSRLFESIDKATESKIAIFCAAGNDGGRQIERIPALLSRDKHVFSVGHISKYSQPLASTILDRNISILGPGDNILSTCNNEGELYSQKSGSSIATPFVAGLASLILEEKRKTNLKFSGLDAAKLLINEAEQCEFGKIINPQRIFSI